MKRVVHCWRGRREDIEERVGYLSDEYIAEAADPKPDGTCLLLDGHDGPHAFTPDSEITVRFSGGPPDAG